MPFLTLEQRMEKLARSKLYQNFQFWLGETDHDVQRNAMIGFLITEIKWEIDASVVAFLQDNSQLPLLTEVDENTFKTEVAMHIASMSQEIDHLVEKHLPSLWNYLAVHKRKATS